MWGRLGNFNPIHLTASLNLLDPPRGRESYVQNADIACGVTHSPVGRKRESGITRWRGAHDLLLSTCRRCKVVSRDCDST
ncbi:hypothetical protein TIFTF001_023677 [Ficus carica]|uniref:Uncharacterized protein n=1 Tax=Ficus carica TaxID=3494 RepID=A0AA88DCN7_FICCA|nr:hypothetical protein TIFTF001_023677 [Ficus carica]